jgi:hypothetical protein
MPSFGKNITYKGYVFRSAVEFAWAQYFEGEGLAWQYEPKTFRTNEGSYTPDFVIPHCCVEIKVWGATVKNRFWLCEENLLICFGLPQKCYIRYKPAGALRLLPGHEKQWTIAYTIARKVAA